MLQNKKLFIPKQILAPKSVSLKKHNDKFVQEIFSKYNVSRNNLAAWFELFYRVDRTYEDYERADIGQLLINIKMQLQILEENSNSSKNHKSSISILSQQALNNFKNQLENTVKTVYSSSNVFQRDLKNELFLNFDAITSGTNLGNIFSFLTREESVLGSSLSFATRAGTSSGNIFRYLNQVKPSFVNNFSFLTRAGTSLGNIFRYLNQVKLSFGNNFSFLTKAEPSSENVLNYLTRVKLSSGNIFSFLTREESVLGSSLSFAIRAGISSGNIFRYLNQVKPSFVNNFSFLTKAEPSSENVLNYLTRVEPSSGSIFSFLTREESVLGSSLSFATRAGISSGNIFRYLNQVKPSFGNDFSFLTGAETSLRNVYSFLTKVETGNILSTFSYEMVGSGKGINSFYSKYMNHYINTIYPIVNINEVNRLYSQVGNYWENYASAINMNPYNFGDYYHIYFPKLSSFIGSGFKMAYIQGESINEFSTVIHDKIVAGLRRELPETLSSAYRLGLFRARNLTKRKQKRELDSQTREFWNNMTYNIIQGFRRELESKTNYFFTNYIDKRAYGVSPFFENEDEDESRESTDGNWTLQENLTHNKHTSFAPLGQRERNGITPHSIYNLKSTYPDIYNMLTFAGLLPTLYVQKHSRETAMSLLSKSIQHYYIGNRNLTVKAYDLLRNKLEKEEKSFIWPEALNNKATMEFRSVSKLQKSSSYMEEIKALKTQVVNIEKQTLQYVHTSSINVNSLVERIYKEIERKIKVDRVRRGY